MSDSKSPEEIEADIARQREELAATVTELHHRVDVKGRAQDKAAELKDRATTESGRPRPDLAAVGVLAVAAVVALVVWRVRRR